MSLPWTPRFVLGLIDLQLTYPVTRWNPGARTTGRVLTSVTGVQGVSLRMRKYTLAFQLVFLEEEWTDVSAFIAAAQYGDMFTWYTNAQDGGVQPASYEAWLDAPDVKTAIKPTRDTTILSLFTLPIVLSRMNAPWDLEYFKAIPG